MKRRRRGSGTLIAVMLTLFITGFVFGMIVIHIVDKKHEEEAIKNLQPIEEIVEETVNVYFPNRKIISGEIPRNSYNPDGYRVENGFLAYYNENGEKISHVGIDVSYHNGTINWDELANSPIEFVMIRCGYRGYSEGGLIQDEKFEEYIKAANERGINVGVYFFSQAISEEEAIAEADYVIKLIDDYKISYPVAFDTELVDDDETRFNQANPSKEELTNICKAFCDRISEAGYYPMIYASENWFRRKLDVASLTDYDFWAPQYLEENDFLYDFTMWQYTEKGSAPGVSGDVDLDICMIDYAQFVPALKEALLTGGEIGEYDSDTPTVSISIDNSGNTDDEED